VDRGAEQIAQDMKAITETRMAIAERLSEIEQHVGTTMQHARTMMSHLEDSTTSAIRETMQGTKDAFNPSIHAARHPWLFVGGALILGYAVGTVCFRDDRRIPAGVIPYYPPGTKGAAVMPTNGAPTSEQRESGVYPFYPYGAIDDRGRDQGRAGLPRHRHGTALRPAVQRRQRDGRIHRFDPAGRQPPLLDERFRAAAHHFYGR